MNEKGLRFNEGKLRHDLIHPIALEGLARILTVGSKKYAERNWEKGMAWSTVIASLKRHLTAIEKGEDFDIETGELHANHLQCNAHFLSAYYKIFPQGDDRQHGYLKDKKIGLDIDEVVCDFTGGWADVFPDCPAEPTEWNYDRKMGERIEEMKQKNMLDSFFPGLKPKVNPKELPFEPYVYVTSRAVSNDLTTEWLDMNGFPKTKVVTVPSRTSKLDVLKELNVDIFVDDKFQTFVELNKNGILCYLMNCPHNKRFDVGHKRLYSLKDLN